MENKQEGKSRFTFGVTNQGVTSIWVLRFTIKTVEENPQLHEFGDLELTRLENYYIFRGVFNNNSEQLKRFNLLRAEINSKNARAKLGK